MSLERTGEEKHLQTEKLLKSPIDWVLFYNLVQKHRNYPIVYKNLKKFENCIPDSSILEKLKILYNRNAVLSLRLTSLLIKTIALLKENNVQAIPLKGPALSQTLYGSIALRTYSDIDILIDVQDLNKAIEVLLHEGYKTRYDHGSISSKKKNSIIKNQHHISFNLDQMSVELHWTYSSMSYKRDFSHLWNETRTVRVAGHDIKAMSCEEEFLYLVFHGTKHGWIRLKWLDDIAQIIALNRADWDLVLEKSIKYDIEHLLIHAVILASRYYQLKIPEVFQNMAKTNRLSIRLSAMSDNIILRGSTDNPYFRLYRVYKFKYFWEKLAYILNLFRPRQIEFNKIDINDRYYFIYYLLRPVFKIKRLLFKRNK